MLLLEEDISQTPELRYHSRDVSSMYLSRLILNPHNAGVRRDVASPYELHRTLMRSMDGNTGAGRLLFRVEPESEQGGTIVLVQSAVEPEWRPLIENNYLLRADGPKTVRLLLTNGQLLRFRLNANPVKKVGRQRIPLKQKAAQKDGDKTYWDWLHRRAQLAGFEILNASDTLTGYSRSTKQKETYAKHEIPHFGVRFDGLMVVRDAEKLTHAVRHGIGPAKAFGYGLLSVAPH